MNHDRLHSIRRARTAKVSLMYISLALSALSILPVVLNYLAIGGGLRCNSVVMLLHEMAIGMPGLFLQFALYAAFLFFDLYIFHQDMKVLERELESIRKGTKALIYKSLQRYYEVSGTSPAFAQAWSMENALP